MCNYKGAFRAFLAALLALFITMPADAARAADMVEKEVVLTGGAAVSLARLFGLTSAGTISLPLYKSTVISVYPLPEPQRFNKLKFSPGPHARLSISPHWWDLQTASPQRAGYVFSSQFLSRNLDASNPWTPFIQRLKRETTLDQWHAMEINTDIETSQKNEVSRCFTSEEKIKLCISVYGTPKYSPITGKPVEYGYSVGVSAQDMTLPVPPTSEKILSETQAAAEKGNVEAQRWLCERLSMVFDDGSSYPLDPDKAMAWCHRAAAQGDQWAMRDLGMMYENGLGVAHVKDDAQAAAWYRKAAEKGEVSAQYSLGEMYYTGRGVAKDYTGARAWFIKAAAQGHGKAQARLGEMYENGYGVEKNYDQAIAWYGKLGPRLAQLNIDRVKLRITADRGDTQAQFELGDIYENGKNDIDQDYAQAISWYTKAAQQGNVNARARLDRLCIKEKSN
jgi:TPR repeat protein